MSANIPELKDKIKRYLNEILDEDAQVMDDGDFVFRYEHGVMFVNVEPWSDDYSFVVLKSPIVFGVPASPEFFEFIARNGGKYRLAQLAIEKWKNEFVVVFNHTMVCELIDIEELELSIAQIAFTVDMVRGEILKKFGGRYPNDG